MLTSDNIPSTGRRTDFQVRQIGYNSVADFAASLPKAAVIADVGAGWSRLGHEVASYRPDIRWINIDPCYANTEAAANMHQDTAATNVELLAEDIVQGSLRLDAMRGTFDLVYSYWMLPHLSLESDAPAEAAAKHMYALLKPAGKLVIGPLRQPGLGFLSPYRYRGTKTYTSQQTEEVVVADILKQTRLWWLPRYVQLLSNRHNIHLGAKLVGGK